MSFPLTISLWLRNITPSQVEENIENNTKPYSTKINMNKNVLNSKAGVFLNRVFLIILTKNEESDKSRNANQTELKYPRLLICLIFV